MVHLIHFIQRLWRDASSTRVLKHHICIYGTLTMGRNAKASSSRLPTTNGKKDKSGRKPPARGPEPEPEIESEEEELDEDLLDGLEEAEEGIAQYAPDDWDGEDASGSGSGSGSDQSDSDAGSGSESEDEGKDDLVRLFPSRTLCPYTDRLAKTPGEPPLNAIVDPNESSTILEPDQ
jgi:hypothetical protein